MRLEELRKLSKKELAEETKKSLANIREAGKELDRLGVWNKNAKKELKENGTTILWKAKSLQ